MLWLTAVKVNGYDCMRVKSLVISMAIWRELKEAKKVGWKKEDQKGLTPMRAMKYPYPCWWVFYPGCVKSKISNREFSRKSPVNYVPKKVLQSRQGQYGRDLLYCDYSTVGKNQDAIPLRYAEANENKVINL